MSRVKIHRYQAGLFPVNAYLIETAEGIIAVDATLGVSDGRMLAAQADALAKPLSAVIVTHTHPDHYGAVGALLRGRDLPVYAIAGVARAIRAADLQKEQILRPMFGEEWARKRVFPNRPVADGARITAAGASLRAVDVGPAESPHDSWWLLEDAGPPLAFIGDLVYSHMHAYLADGHYEAWLQNLQRARRELPADATLYMGHGEPSPGLALLDWQTNYIERFLEAMLAGRRAGLETDALTVFVATAMRRVWPGDELLFLLQLSVPALAGQFSNA